MRLICCFQFDEIIDAFKRSQLVMTRAQLDARNDPNTRASSFESLVIEQFNNRDWVAKSEAIPELHEDFAQEHEYRLRPEYHLDRKKLKTIMVWEKTRITEMIRKYNQSGRGAENADEMYQLGEEEDDDDMSEDKMVHAKYGHFNPGLAEQEGGDDRSDYLNGEPSDVLYWWDVFDKLDIITMVCAMMKRGIGASSDEQPSSISHLANKKKKGKKNSKMTEERHEAIMKNQEKMIENGKRISDSMDRKELNSLEREAFDLDSEIYDIEDNPTVSRKKLNHFRKRRKALGLKIKSMEQKLYKKARTEATNEQNQDDEEEEGDEDNEDDQDDDGDDNEDNDGEDESDGDDE
jgi:hypothetical protein